MFVGFFLSVVCALGIPILMCEKKIDSTRKFVDIYLFFTCMTNLILALLLYPVEKLTF